jgi:hypothetical protein
MGASCVALMEWERIGVHGRGDHGAVEPGEERCGTEAASGVSGSEMGST